MSRVILVRHALSVADPNVDSTQWGLAEGAVEEAERLAAMLPDDVSGPVWTSTERKAVETARAIARVRGLDVATDERFGEVVRPWSDGDYRAIAERYLSGDAAADWEPQADVLSRFTAAIEDASGEGILAVVNHGLAMSLYVASVCDIDVVTFWSSLTFPDAWAVDGATGAPRRLFDADARALDQT